MCTFRWSDLVRTAWVLRTFSPALSKEIRMAVSGSDARPEQDEEDPSHFAEALTEWEGYG